MRSDVTVTFNVSRDHLESQSIWGLRLKSKNKVQRGEGERKRRQFN